MLDELMLSDETMPVVDVDVVEAIDELDGAHGAVRPASHHGTRLGRNPDMIQSFDMPALVRAEEPETARGTEHDAVERHRQAQANWRAPARHGLHPRAVDPGHGNDRGRRCDAVYPAGDAAAVVAAGGHQGDEDEPGRSSHGAFECGNHEFRKPVSMRRTPSS